MPKDSFNKIKINDAIIAPVGQFNGITGRGKKRPTLSPEEHKELVHKKYDDAKKMNDHITLFRVPDKQDLGYKEQREHTVQGPVWTPSVSVASVMGALSNGNRVWLATKPTNDSNGLLGKNDEPSILAREITVVVKYGWISRETQAHEKYGCTTRQPKAVFTPPLSPRNASLEELQNLMDTSVGWGRMPITVDGLTNLSTPIPKELSDAMKKARLTRAELGDELITIVLQTKGVMKLLEDDNLSLVELSDTSINTTKELLSNDEVILLLSEGEAKFTELADIYSEYIEDSNNKLEELSFKKFYDLINGNKSKLDQLLSDLSLSIGAVIRLYNEDDIMFCALANNRTISFLQEYSNEIDIWSLAEIYCQNQELFDTLINDQKEQNILPEVGIDDFIIKFEEIKRELEDDGLESAYEILVARVKEEEGYTYLNDFSGEDDESDGYGYNYNASTDEDEAYDLTNQFKKIGFSEENESAYTPELEDDSVELLAQVSNFYSSDEDY